MSIDTPAPSTQQSPASSYTPSPTASPIPERVLTNDVHLRLHRGTEKDRYEQLQGREYLHTPLFDPAFLQETGMNSELQQVFNALGWANFKDTSEQGCRLLTLEFLCTLQSNREGVTFRMFRQEFSLSWRDLSNALGFSPYCHLKIDSALEDYQARRFWKDLT